MGAKKRTVKDIRDKKQHGEKITMLTAYDYSFARMIDAAGIDMLLVGDSLGMVLLGYDSTVPVTMDEMIHHARAVSRAKVNAVVVGDMPFLSYQASCEDAIRNAGRFMKEAGCDCVKVEGGTEIAPIIAALSKAGIPVIGHIGLTPQTAGRLGGFKVQGKDRESARYLVESAIALEAAGAFAIVLECLPAALATYITGKISIPTIGIGAGCGCDGQVLVIHDLIGLFDKFVPSFVKQYCNLAPEITKAVESYIREVKTGKFPSDEQSFLMNADVEALIKG